MRERITVPREQVIRRIREAGFKYRRTTRRVDIYGRPNNTTRLDIVLRKRLPESYVRTLLTQAGLTHEQVEQFLRDCVAA